MTETIPFDHKTNTFIHQWILTAVWSLIINISVIAIQFKSKKFVFLIHFILGVSVIAMTLIGPIIFIIEHGVQLYHKTWYKYTHNIIGFTTFCIIPLQGVFGYLIKRSQQKNYLSLKNINIFKAIHKCLGFSLLFLAKTAYMIRCVDHWQFFPLIIFEGVSLFLLIIIKLRSKKLIPKIKQFSLNKFKIIKKLKDLQQFSSEFFIVADKVYSLLSVKNFHPGGVSIIQEMKGRQIDRFLYGCNGPQMNPYTKFEHPMSSLDLLKYPIAQLKLHRPYKNMKQINSCKIISLTELDNGQTYLIKLALKQVSEKVDFLGYQKLEQFGYYHSFSLNNNITRLYTGVNCLRSQNIARIKSILNLMKIPSTIQLKDQSKTFNTKINQKNLLKNIRQSKQFLNESLLSQSVSSIEDNQQFYVPLLVKKYQKGKFTSKMFDLTKKTQTKKQMHLSLSSPLGLGLSLEQLQKGKIVFLAGGTGLFPYIDFIDILFKADLINRQFNGSKMLQFYDPILKEKTRIKTQKQEYVLILTLRHISDIHPLTVFQINHLCSKDSTINFRCKLKCPRNQIQVEKRCENMLTSVNVVTQTIQEAMCENLKKLFICGPPGLQKQIICKLKQQKISTKLFHIL